MTTTELLAIFRAEVYDLELPDLWSDALVYGHIDDAQKQFCRDTYGIADARSFKISIKADGTEWYKYDSRILKIRDATFSDTGRRITTIPVEKMEAHGLRFDGRQGPAQALITGLEANTFRCTPVPNVAAVINLLTFRLPADIGAGDDLEIEPQHHLGLLHWMKYRAYGVQDAETQDRKASETHLAKHYAYCAKVLQEQSRSSHEASSVIYGGI